MQALPCGGSFSHVVDSSTPLRSGRNDRTGGRVWFLLVTVPSFRAGTAHRPFPTVRLGLFTFAPIVSTMRNAALPVFRTTAVVKYPNQRNRRKRPMCRSGNAPNTTRADKTEQPPDMSVRANAVSRGIYSSCKLYLVLVHYPTWWIPPLRFAAVGMTQWGDVFGYYRKQFRPFGPERHTGRSPRFR